MRNIKIGMEYDGTHFFGWQIQPEKRTVQGVLESTLEEFLKKKTGVVGAGRTDTGVHALGQVANFPIEKEYDPKTIRDALNARLPRDIHVKEACEVDQSFHARFSALSRVYLYRISTFYSVFTESYSWFCDYRLDVETMNEACSFLKGKKDCTSFAIAKSKKENMDMSISRCHFLTHDSEILFEIEANRFLHKSVRTMVGTLLLLGSDKINLEEFKDILESKDRTKAGKTAPPHGLYLKEVKY
jgi:tRNA pseudouridine38-40 synthase